LPITIKTGTMFTKRTTALICGAANKRQRQQPPRSTVIAPAEKFVKILINPSFLLQSFHTVH
jgi:hypothetical protein